MPRLKCGVDTCAYWRDKYCIREASVKGEKAAVAETRCSSYRPRSRTARNSSIWKSANWDPPSGSELRGSQLYFQQARNLPCPGNQNRRHPGAQIRRNILFQLCLK